MKRTKTFFVGAVPFAVLWLFFFIIKVSFEFGGMDSSGWWIAPLVITGLSAFGLVVAWACTTLGNLWL